MIIISSNAERVQTAVSRLASPNFTGAVGDVRDEEAFTKVLLEHAPVHHIVFSGVDKIIRGKLEDLDLEEAKSLFGVKFWGSLVLGKGLWDISGSSLLVPLDETSSRAVDLGERGEELPRWENQKGEKMLT